MNNIFEESENDVQKFIKLSLKSKMNRNIKNDILRVLSSIPARGSPFPDFYGNIKSLNSNPLPADFSKLFNRGVEKLEPKGRTERFRVPGDDNIFYFKHLTQDKGPDELLREISLLEAIQKGIVETGDIEKNNFPVIVAHPENGKSLFDFSPDVPFVLNNDIEKKGIIYTAPKDYFSYITEDNSRKLHNPEDRLRTITGALENSLDLALSLWRQGIFMDVDIYHREQRFKWLGQYIDNKAEKVGTIRISAILEWFKYPNISVSGPRDFGHYQLWNEIKEAEGAISKIGNYLIYYTFIAAAAFYNNRLKKRTFKDFISRQYKKVGVNVYGGFADEMWQAVQNKPIFVGKLGTRGLFLKPQTLDAIFEFSVFTFFSFLGIGEKDAFSAKRVEESGKDMEGQYVSSAIQEAQALQPITQNLGPLCLTPDSLITLANGSQKPLIELSATKRGGSAFGGKPQSTYAVDKGKEEQGDMVLSLNEATGKLEPHRVLALLDMGVKPVYRITTESGKSLKTTLTHPYLTKNGWRKLSEIKAGEEVSAVSESFGNTAGVNERNFIPSNNYQRIFEKVKDVFFYNWRQDLKKANRHKGIDSKEDYSFVSSQRESIETTEVSIQRKYNPIFFCAERGNLFITCSFQPYISGFNDIIAGFLQEFNCAAEKAMVSKQPHSTYLVDNNLFVFEDSCGIVKAGFNVFNSDIRIALLDNLFGSKSLLNKFQDHIQRDSRSFDTGFAKANFGVSRDSFFQSIVSHYFHLLIILYHKIKEASSCILRPNAYAQLVSESDILWDKIISIEPLGSMPVYDIEVEATHNFVAQGILAHNTYSQGAEEKAGPLPFAISTEDFASSPLKTLRPLSLEELRQHWNAFQSGLWNKGLNLPEFRRYIPTKAYVSEKETQGKELKIIFFIIEKKQKQFHSYELYYLSGDMVGYGTNGLLPDGVIDLSMHIFKEQRKGGYSKDIWEHRLDSLLSIYEDVGRIKDIKSFLVRPNQFSYVQPESDIAEGPRALFFYLKRGFRPEDVSLHPEIDRILQELESRNDGDRFVELGERLKELKITVTPLYLLVKDSLASSSVASTTSKEIGGVEFTHLPIISQPEIGLGPTMASSPQINISHLNLDEEWAQIQNMLNAEIMPSSERLREYALASSSLKSEDYSREIDKLLGCIADILRLEEERVLPTKPALREMLALLESDKPAQELQLALSKITVLPKEYIPRK